MQSALEGERETRYYFYFTTDIVIFHIHIDRAGRQAGRQAGKQAETGTDKYALVLSSLPRY